MGKLKKRLLIIAGAAIIVVIAGIVWRVFIYKKPTCLAKAVSYMTLRDHEETRESTFLVSEGDVLFCLGQDNWNLVKKKNFAGVCTTKVEIVSIDDEGVELLIDGETEYCRFNTGVNSKHREIVYDAFESTRYSVFFYKNED